MVWLYPLVFDVQSQRQDCAVGGVVRLGGVHGGEIIAIAAPRPSGMPPEIASAEMPQLLGAAFAGSPDLSIGLRAPALPIQPRDGRRAQAASVGRAAAAFEAHRWQRAASYSLTATRMAQVAGTP